MTVTALVDNDTANGTATVTFSSPGINSSQVQVTENDIGANSTAGYMFGGVVSNELGMGIPGVTLTFSDGIGALTTDENGSFHRELSNGWNGTITPSKDGYSFSPSNIAISSHSSHSVSHVLVGTRSSVLFVDADALGSGDGTSWANAYTDLSEALLAEQAFTKSGWRRVPTCRERLDLRFSCCPPILGYMEGLMEANRAEIKEIPPGIPPFCLAISA